MIRSIRAVFAAAALALSGGMTQARDAQSHFVLVQNAIEKFAVPRFEVLDKAAAALPPVVRQVCETGDDAAREDLQGRFRAVVQAWAAVEFLRFGPMAQEGRRERVSFWPDPRGIMARQVRQLLAAKDMKVFEAAAFPKQSAAVQGLPALEFLSTDKEHPLAPGEAPAMRCGLANAIALNVAILAHEMADGWTKPGGWKEKMLRPGSDNDTYKEPAEAAGEFVKSLLTGLQIVGDLEVKPRLDNKDKPAASGQGKPAVVSGPFEKSDLARPYYVAGAASLDALYRTIDLEGYLPEDKDWVKNWAGGTWRSILASDGAGGAAPGAKRDDAPTVKELASKIGGLRQLIGKEMAAAAGLSLGFNELDGD